MIRQAIVRFIEVFTGVLEAHLEDINMRLDARESAEYVRGFEDGRESLHHNK